MLALLGKGFLLSLSLCLDIGIVNTAVINAGLRFGVAPAFWIGLGSCFGDLFYAALSLAGLALIMGYAPVRWVFWVLGSVVLAWFAWKMALAAWREARGRAHRRFDANAEPPTWTPRGEFLRGLALALASPSSLAWFVAVGGSLIARSTDGSLAANATFLTGFFLGGLAYSTFIAVVAGRGRHFVGDRLVLYSHALSAALFAYLAADVLIGGYRSLIALQVPAAGM
jgi:L-lysine exporter family protein LysE/ArgO